jgi:hypothetical protein
MAKPDNTWIDDWEIGEHLQTAARSTPLPASLLTIPKWLWPWQGR